MLSANPEINVSIPMPSSEVMFWKRALHKYVHVYTYIYILEKLFTKTQSLNSALTLQTHFREWRFTRFGKELFICVHGSSELLQPVDSDLDCTHNKDELWYRVGTQYGLTLAMFILAHIATTIKVQCGIECVENLCSK